MTPSRRRFLAAGLALPAAASATRSSEQQQELQHPAKPALSGPVLKYRTLGKTGLKVT